MTSLTSEDGEQSVADFIYGTTFAVNDGLKRATAAEVKLPAAPADLQHAKMAHTLVLTDIGSDDAW